MEKRYQVFISSTYQDLHLERQELIRALLELDCIPAGMELFPASDDDAWTLIKRVIDESDYYLVVSAGRYGSEHPVSGLGYTEMEYDYAVKQGKPVIAFLHNDLSGLAVEKCDTENEKREKLAAFREKMKKKVVKEYSSPEMLAGVASRSIVQLIKQKPGVGWIRADSSVDPRAEAEISQLRLKISEREKEIEKLKKDTEASQFDIVSPLDSIKGLEKAKRYIEAQFGSEKVFPIIYEVFRYLHDQPKQFVPQIILSSHIAMEFDIEDDFAGDIVHALHSDGAIAIDNDDEIHVGRDVTSAFRELRLQANLRSSASKGQGDSKGQGEQ